MNNLIQSLTTYNVFSPKIKIGNPKSDGGYIINEAIADCTDRLVSLGIGLEDSFEIDWFERYKTPIEAYDGNYVCQNLCAKFPEEVNKKIFYIENHVGYDSKQIPLNVIIDDKKNILLKVDIEGDEYKIFDHVTINDNVVGIILEVHDLYQKENQQKLDYLINEKFKNFLLFHVHGNSWGGTFDLNLSKINNRGIVIEKFPVCMELSFINKRLLANWEYETEQFPVKDLDISNNENEPDINLYWINSL